MLGYIASGVSEGAKVLCGGGPPEGFSKGFYVAPTVLTNVEPSMKVNTPVVLLT